MSDELEPLITRCPNCDTRFRVNETQLQAALGQVRCGACLTVFDGTSYLLLDGELIASEAEDVDALLTELDAQEQDLDTPATEPEFAPAPATEVEPMVAELVDRVETADMELEELEAQLLAELRGETVPLRRTVPAFTDPDEEPAQARTAPTDSGTLDNETEDSGTEDSGTEDSGTEDSGTEGSGPEGGAEEHDSDKDVIEGEIAAQGSAAAPAEEMQPTDAAFNELLAANQAQSGAGSAATVEPGSTASGTPAAEQPEEETRLNDAEPVQNFDVEPDALDEQPWLENERPAAQIPRVDIPPELLEDEPPRRSWLTWVLLVIAAIALPTQVLWYQFEDWSKDATLRPLYAQACALLGCELPVQRDVGLINARNSVLRDHPDVEDALIYDALLINQAAFQQPFPLVELTLTSISGHLVASRRFKPTEYLAGDVRAEQMMVPHTPVHISLAIKDPGEAPLNFKVRFLPFD